MPRKFIKRYMPDHQKIRDHKSLKFFGKLIHDPNLWHLNRRSVAGAFAVGLFSAFVPIPSQMVLAAAAAILFRVNLPISVALVWVTNPVTMPPVYYFAYQVGTWVLGTPEGRFRFELSVDWLMTEMVLIWKPFLLGCFILGTLSAVIGYLITRLLWRWHVVRQLRDKREKASVRVR